ncbi:DUF927 domain-containing protein [Geobacter grbiciae]|uniref:DUF927 domain-containing protein n=1 Tax=Geobacter grbiciae TaxID=155042 RepID=UPI001C026FA6|nr:DUF927 domain-containing protein [Geobacter grbiciae]MBT1073955.1 DUF927 domain-containing protein [Geobacter grbiciae]
MARGVYQPGTSGSEGKFAVSGNLEHWKNHVAVYCPGNSRLIFSMSSAFAAPLLRPLGMEGGGFHLFGDSTGGKSTFLKIVASVCGGPDYIRGWRSTDNALEEVAAGHNDALLILDEMAQIDPRKVGDIAYMLANEMGKLRSGYSGTRPLLTWRLLTLSSGEITLSECMHAGGKKAMAGQEVRLVDIPADAGAGSGLFECLHGFERPEELASLMQTNASCVYGSPFVEFLECLTADLQGGLRITRDAMSEFLSQFQRPNAAPQQRRIMKRFALVAAAGELTTHYGITGWPPGEAMRGVAKCLRDWEAFKYGDEIQRSDQMVEQVLCFLESQGKSRFQDLQDRNFPGAGCAGFRHGNDNGVIDFFIKPEVFHTEVCAGFDTRQMCRLLSSRGILIAPTGRYEVLQRVPAYGGKACRFYHLML